MNDRTGSDLHALFRVAEEARLETRVLMECIERRIVAPVPHAWDESEIERARRVRRLTDLGINLAGVEVIFHMRQSLRRTRKDVARLERELKRLRRQHDRELAGLLRQIAEVVESSTEAGTRPSGPGESAEQPDHPQGKTQP